MPTGPARSSGEPHRGAPDPSGPAPRPGRRGSCLREYPQGRHPRWWTTPCRCRPPSPAPPCPPPGRGSHRVPHRSAADPSGHLRRAGWGRTQQGTGAASSGPGTARGPARPARPTAPRLAGRRLLPRARPRPPTARPSATLARSTAQHRAVAPARLRGPPGRPRRAGGSPRLWRRPAGRVPTALRWSSPSRRWAPQIGWGRHRGQLPAEVGSAPGSCRVPARASSLPTDEGLGRLHRAARPIVRPARRPLDQARRPLDPAAGRHRSAGRSRVRGRCTPSRR
jgi:hypothetical protein